MARVSLLSRILLNLPTDSMSQQLFKMTKLRGCSIRLQRLRFLASPSIGMDRGGSLVFQSHLSRGCQIIVQETRQHIGKVTQQQPQPLLNNVIILGSTHPRCLERDSLSTQTNCTVSKAIDSYSKIHQQFSLASNTHPTSLAPHNSRQLTSTSQSLPLTTWQVLYHQPKQPLIIRRIHLNQPPVAIRMPTVIAEIQMI